MEIVAYLGPLVPPKAFEVNFTINPPLLAPVTTFWSLVKKLSKSVALKTKLVFCGHILAPAGIVKLLSAAPVLNERFTNPAYSVEGVASPGWIRGGVPSRDLTRDTCSTQTK